MAGFGKSTGRKIIRFEDAPVVGQDFASRPAATLRSVIERCRFVLPVRRLKSRQRYF